MVGAVKGAEAVKGEASALKGVTLGVLAGVGGSGNRGAAGVSECDREGGCATRSIPPTQTREGAAEEGGGRTDLR